MEGHSKNVSFSNFNALKNSSTQIRLFGKPGVSGKRRMGFAVALGVDIENAKSKAAMYGFLNILIKHILKNIIKNLNLCCL